MLMFPSLLMSQSGYAIIVTFAFSVVMVIGVPSGFPTTTLERLSCDVPSCVFAVKFIQANTPIWMI